MIKPRMNIVFITIKKISCFLLLSIALSIRANCQDGNIAALPDDYFINNNEKVFVHLNKTVFVSGESMQYKAYVVNASTLQLSSLSKVIYFEISDYKNRPVMIWRSNLINNMASGSIELPDTISAGIYHLKSFTNWMRNTSPSFYYNTPIVITNIADKELEKSGSASMYITNNQSITFFPEGGTLVEGIENNVGFRIKQEYIGNVRSVGIVRDNNNIKVDSFSVNASGWGKFRLYPASGKSYSTELKLPSGNIITEPLPEIKKLGYTLAIENIQKSSICFAIKTNANEFINFESLRLVTVSKGRIANDTNVIIKNGAGQLIFSTKRLPKGIFITILLDPFNKPVCERLVYVAPDRPFELKMGTQKDGYQKREKVRLEFEVENLPGDETAYLSVSVSEQVPFGNMANDDIDSYLYYYSELASTYSQDRSEPLILERINDLLLLTSPWEYAWNITPANIQRPCQYIMEDQGFVLTGRVLDRTHKTPFVNALVILAVSDSLSKIDYCYTDSIGKFYFLLTRLHDNKDLLLQLEGHPEAGDDVLWEFDTKNGQLYHFNQIPVNVTREMQEYLDYTRKIVLTNSIYKSTLSAHGDTAKIHLAPVQQNSFYGKPYYVIFPSDFLELADFKEISDNLLSAVKFKHRRDLYSLRLYDWETSNLWEKEGTVFLNGVPFKNLSYLASLGSKDIKRIDIVPSQYFYGDLSFYGIVSIYTYDGKIPETYYNGRVCRYNNRVQTSSITDDKTQLNRNLVSNPKIPDFRQTLYWNPSVQIRGTNKVVVEFFTSDLKTTYNIRIQGIAGNGYPLSASKTIYVK